MMKWIIYLLLAGSCWAGSTNWYSIRPNIPYGGANTFEKDKIPLSLATNVVAWWTFPQTNRSGTQYTYNVNRAINDLKINGAIITNNGSSAIRFDGIDDRGYSAWGGGITSSFMIASWIWPLKTLNAQNDFSCWFYTYNRPANYSSFFIAAGNSDFIRAGFEDTSGTERSVDTPAILNMVSNWWWVALTFDDPNNTLTIWTNGAFCTNKTGITQTPFNNTGDLTLGCIDKSGYLQYWAGVMDDVVVFRNYIDTNSLIMHYQENKAKYGL